MRAAALVLLLALPALPALAFDPEQALAVPGVRLVALEFYATWCHPCMDAVPKWKALHEKYKREGLRLVVVATQDPKGGCTNPGWNPDDIICDDDGALAARFGAQSLPAAFLWSWQGPLLVNKGHVEDVERAIDAWMRETPRVEVSVADLPSGSGITKAALEGLVRGRLQDQDKLIVIATEAERKKLDAIKARSLENRYDAKLACEIGLDLSANSLLEAFISPGPNRRLSLALLSAERGCLVANAFVDWNAEKSNVAVAAAVAELMRKIRRPAELPWATKAAPAPVTVSAPREAPPPVKAPVSSGTDRDGDGVSDATDKCPDQPETKNGFADEDGCPDALPNAVVAVLRDAREIKFQTAKPALLPASSRTLDRIAKVLAEFSDLRVRIEVHSDSAGAEEYNQRLTEQRADTVRAYLIGKQIAGTRLESAGYGSAKPIAPNTTASGRDANRRVEMHLISTLDRP